MEKFVSDTISLCPKCLEVLNARIFEKDNHIWMRKSCSQHGAFEVIIEPDPLTYYAMEHESNWNDKNVHTLTLPITYKCNMYCSYCYIDCGAVKEDLKIDEIKEIINDFKGIGIAISGGEPTLNHDLGEIIEYAVKSGKKVGVVTNGIKLSSEKYLNSLMKSGHFNVFFSLDSFKDEFYSKVKSEGRILELKQKALESLHKNKISTTISSTIYKGLNDDEFCDIFRYCINNRINRLRLRNAQSIGRSTEEYTGYYLSEIIDLFCEQTGYKRNTILFGAKWQKKQYYQYTVGRLVRFIKIGGKYIPLNFQEQRMSKFSRIILFSFVKLKIVRSLFIRFIHLPTAETITGDGIVEKGMGHLYDKKPYNFLHALMLQDKL